MFPAITHLQAPTFRTENDSDAMATQSTHPCHRLSIPAARLFWCRHCMQIFEDPITRWRHSKTCLQSSSGKVKKDKDGSTMQVFLSSKNLSELRRDQNRSRAISRSSGPGHSPGTDLRCFICKTTFVSIEEMRSHVRTPCRKRPTIPAPKHKFATLPDDIKTQIQIPDTASEIIYIKDGHQTVISLESPCTAELIKSEFEEPSQGYEPDGISGREEMILLPDTFDCTSNLNTIEQTVEISAVETVIPFMIKNEEIPKPPKNRTENKENNIRKRKRILPKEVDDRPNHKTNNSPKSEQQIALSLPTRPDDIKDTLEDIEVPPMKFCKMTNKEAEDEMSQTKVRTKPLQTKEELGQLLIGEKKDNQVFLVGEHLSNGVITEQVADGDIFLKAPASPEEKIVTGDAAEAKLKDLFTSMEMMNKTKLSRSPKQTKTVSSPRKSPKKTGSPMKIKSKDMCQNNDEEDDRRQVCISQEETNDMSGLLLYMPPINAGSVTLHDPLLDLQNGLPAEMLLDETTNTKPPIPATPEAINAIVSSGMDVTKLPLHIFDGDLLPSQIHSEVLFEEMIDEKEKETPSLVNDQLAQELISAETNFEYFVKIESSDEVTEEIREVEEFTTVSESDPPYTRHLEENQEVPLEESELEQTNEESMSPIAESLEMLHPNPTEENAELKTNDEAGEAIVAEKAKTETKIKSAKLFKCKACSNTFKTSQALQKHSRVPCILKHTRSLSQKILRPKQPCMKIEKKPIKKKLARPARRPKFMIPIMPITRSELIRPAVPKRPKRFSRRKKRRSFFIDEHNRILPYVNVIMSELSDKDRFFYKLGMINQCRKIPSSETTTTTAPNAETSAVETLDEDSAVDSSSSTLQFTGIKTESMNPLEIGPLSAATAAEVAAAEPLGIAYPATPAAACVSDKENLSALAKGLCLSLPTLEKMDDTQFHDPNCISTSHIKPDPDEPYENPSGVTGQSLQSPCLETSSQLPGVSQIARVAYTDPLSTDPLKTIITTNESSTTRGSDQSDVLAESKCLAVSDFRQHCKIQSKKISEEMVNKYDSYIGGHLTAKNTPCKEPLGNICASQSKTASLQDRNRQEQSCSDAAQKDLTNLFENNMNKKIQPNSVNKDKNQQPKDRKKTSVESKKLLKRDGFISPDKSNQSHSSVDRNSRKSKLSDYQTAKNNVMESADPTKNHDRNLNKNQKQTDSCTGANIGTVKKKIKSVDSNISNLQKTTSSSLSKNVASLSSKKTTVIQDFEKSVYSSKKVAIKQESPIITPSSDQGVASKWGSPMATTVLCKKEPLSPESLVASMALSLTTAPSQESHVAGNPSVKKPGSQESAILDPTLCKKVTLNQNSPMATATSSKKIPSNNESPIVTNTSGIKIAQSQESSKTILCKTKPSSPGSSISTTTLLRNIASNQESCTVTPTLVKKSLSIEYPMADSILYKEVPSKQKSLIATTSLGMNKESPITTATLNKTVPSSQESPLPIGTLCKKVPSSPGEKRASGHGSPMAPLSQESLVANPTISKTIASSWNSTTPISSSSQNVISNQHATSSSKKMEFNAGTSMIEKTNLVSVKIEKSVSDLLNDQNNASPICTLPAITSRLSSIAFCSPDSGSLSDLTSLADQSRPNTQRFCKSETLTRENQSGEPAAQDNNIATPILKSLHIDVEEMRKSSSDVNNQRHFSDIFGHEKDSLAGEDSNVNLQISPSKERSKRHFTDFLCGFSREAAASLAKSTGQMHSGSFLEKIQNIKIEESTDLETLKTNKTVATSTSRNREKSSGNSHIYSEIGSNNKQQVAGIPAVSCVKPVDQNSGNERLVRMIESSNGSVVNEKLKHRNPSPVSVKCQSKSPVAELQSGESLLNSSSSDPHKTGTTTVVTVRNTAMTTELNFGVDASSVTNSSPGDLKAPSPDSELKVSPTANSNPRVSISTQTNTSFLHEIKTGLSAPLDSCDNAKIDETPSSNPAPRSSSPVPSPSSQTNIIPPPIIIDNAPIPLVLKEERCEEVVQENFHLGPSVLASPQEIIINDTPLSPGSLYPQGTICEPIQEDIVLQENNTEAGIVLQQPGTICELVQEDSGLQVDNTEDSVLLQQSVLDPSNAVALESPLQQFVLDNGTDPNVIMQYLNSLDPSMVPQEVTFVIIQGTPGEPLQLTDDFIIEQTALSEHAEHESASQQVIYAIQPPQSDITTEAECIMTDST